MTMKAGKRRRLQCGAAPPPREAEEKEGRRSTSFFCRAYASYVLKNLEVTFFFAFAHFLLYTKDPDLLQALDLPVMPTRNLVL